MTKKKNQTIGCNVESCKYNDCDYKQCTLNEIKVSSDCKYAEDKDDTICDSYESKNGE